MAEQKSLDRPELREKLTEAFCINSGDILPQCNECIHFNSVSEHRCDNPKIDELLALIPDIEEAKKQEGEELKDKFTVTGGYISGETKYIKLEMKLSDWQAFKKKK